MRSGFTMLEMASEFDKGFNMWEMTYIVGKWLKYLKKRSNYVGNDLDLWELAQIFGEIFDKRLKNVENHLEIWENAKIFRKWLRYMGHGFRI